MSDKCQTKNKKGFLNGLLLGLLPHTFCVLFIVFSVLGAIGAASFAKKFLLVPHLFWILLVLSLLFATIGSVIHLRSSGCCATTSKKYKVKYVLTMYTTTILTNILMMYVIFPGIANVNIASASISEVTANIVMNVDIPCPGHAPLIVGEIKKDLGVVTVKFTAPNQFEVVYDPSLTSQEKIKALEIFETFKILN